jgi:hypothetical protein
VIAGKADCALFMILVCVYFLPKLQSEECFHAIQVKVRKAVKVVMWSAESVCQIIGFKS